MFDRQIMPLVALCSGDDDHIANHQGDVFSAL